MNVRENILRAVRFEKPDHIPMVFHINAACWNHYPVDFLNELIASHPLLFHDTEDQQRSEIKYKPIESVGKPFVDGWGCVWRTTEDGITGTVVEHPLKNWDNFSSYAAPDPKIDCGRGPVDWRQIRSEFEQTRSRGRIAMGGLRHGHTFMTLADIRGYENLILDMADDEPRLLRLIEIVENFNMEIVNYYIQAGAEWMSYPEDLGMQTGPMISPAHFRKYIKPSYQRLMVPARRAGCIVHMHSDGYIRDLVDVLIGGGIDILNLQDLVNGIEWIKSKLAGKLCIDIDIDRQQITRFGTLQQIDSLIFDEVKTLGSKNGGLMMIYGLYPGVPRKNIKALTNAMEKYGTYYA